MTWHHRLIAAAHRRFTAALARDEPMLEAIAWELCGGDPDVYNDLLQVGRIALWELVRRRPVLPDAAHVRVVARHRMLEWWRRERRAQIIVPMRGRTSTMKRAA